MNIFTSPGHLDIKELVRYVNSLGLFHWHVTVGFRSVELVQFENIMRPSCDLLVLCKIIVTALQFFVVVVVASSKSSGVSNSKSSSI
jgi:hypothetical protein